MQISTFLQEKVKNSNWQLLIYIACKALNQY